MVKNTNYMNKKDLIDAVAKNGEMTKKDAAKAIDTVVTTIMSTLNSGVGIQLVGFGTFSVVDVPARTARNPQTGKPVKVPAKKKPVFKFSGSYKNTFKD